MQIAITGCGWVTPRSVGRIEDVLNAYAQTGHFSANYEPNPKTIFDQFPNLPGEASKEGNVAIAAIALEIAWNQAGLTPGSWASDRKGLVLGSALAGVTGMIDFANDVRTQSTRFVSPIRFPQTVGNYICGALARGYDFRGPASTIACGSASSLEAVREGCALLASGQADGVVAGGSEMLSPEMIESLDLPEVRFAEGACLFVLEREAAARDRGAVVLASIPVPAFPDESPSAGHSVSVAGQFESGAICIEHWTGRTLGADGAAAMAAAIGSSMKLPVPCFGNCPAEINEAYLVAQGTAPHRRTMLVRASSLSDEIHELKLVLE